MRIISARVLVLDTAELLNDLISPREQRGGHIEPERLRSLQVDHQLVLGRRLHRKVAVPAVICRDSTRSLLGGPGAMPRD
jgi:hypothetical protein